MTNVAINGFGRIGRAAAKITLESPVMNLVAINDLGDIPTLAHLLKYDSCYGIYEKEVGYKDNGLIVNTHNIRFFSEKNPKDLPWKALEIDVVLESTGVFLTKELAKSHITAGAKKVVLSAPPKDESVPIYVIGSNEKKYNGEDIVSNASCTTNCIAPVMKVLDDVFGIEKSMMTTVHSYTADQSLVDGPHKDLRRARAAAENIIPTSTGAAKASGEVLPSIQGKFDGLAIRVPVVTGSLSDITVVLKKKVTKEEVNKAFVDACKTSRFAGVLTITNEPLVSSDFIGSTYSGVVDLSLTYVVEGDLVKVIAWYDNEYGYAHRIVELAQLYV